MLRFFQNAAKQTAVGTGSILATTIVANVTYQLGLFAYDSVKNRPHRLPENPSTPPTGAGTTNRLRDDSHDNTYDITPSEADGLRI